jgi:ABC-type Fe3+-hydroxamate transport system substrate-binding protein
VKRRELVIRGAAALLALGAGCTRRGAPASPGRRVVALAPAVTETLFAIGAGGDVVAVSDYCDTPDEVQRLPRVGTSITPNYEAIARFAPTLIVSESNAATKSRELQALAPTRLLPWLTLH